MGNLFIYFLFFFPNFLKDKSSSIVFGAFILFVEKDSNFPFHTYHRVIDFLLYFMFECTCVLLDFIYLWQNNTNIALSKFYLFPLRLYLGHQVLVFTFHFRINFFFIFRFLVFELFFWVNYKETLS